jgi:hypothetical protein
MRVYPTGGWRKLHNEELHDLCSFRNIIGIIKSRMRWAGRVERIGATRNLYFCRKHDEGNSRFGRHRRRWDDNIKMDLE